MTQHIRTGKSCIEKKFTWR